MHRIYLSSADRMPVYTFFKYYNKYKRTEDHRSSYCFDIQLRETLKHSPHNKQENLYLFLMQLTNMGKDL